MSGYSEWTFIFTDSDGTMHYEYKEKVTTNIEEWRGWMGYNRSPYWIDPFKNEETLAAEAKDGDSSSTEG
jgi:hypothetical protein